MGKASAPNLQSFSRAAASSSQLSPAESSGQSPWFEPKSYGNTPLLSPTISELEGHPVLSIQPNRGKVTTIGVFTRPT
jgi:hypothetical protein